MSRPGTILFICSEPPAAADAQPWQHGARTVQIDLRSPLDLVHTRRALDAAARDADLVVSRGVQAQLAGVLVARRRGIPHVADAAWTPAGRGLSRAQRLLLRLSAPKTDGVVTTDPAQLPALVELGYAPVRMRVVPANGAMGTAAAYEEALADVLTHAAEGRESTASPAGDWDAPKRSLLPRKVARRLNSALSRGPGYEPTPPGTQYAVDGSAVRGYYLDFRAKTTSPSARVPTLLLPSGLAQLALGWWERSLAGEATAGVEFQRMCELLEARAERRDGSLLWPYDMTVAKYPSAWPPYSSMAQAQAASVFVRAYAASGDERDAERARRAIRPILEEGSALVTATDAGPIPEESPGEPPSHILNGWIYSLWGLRDVELALGSAQAGTLYERSLDCLRRLIDRYDVGWWTRYSLYPHRLADLAKPFYHRLHTDQAEVLYRLTGFAEFGAAARRWREYDTPVNRARAVAQKLAFVSTGYA